jgi:outer membrane protein TolC
MHLNPVRSKRIVVTAVVAFCCHALSWGQLTIEQCYQLAHDNYPVIKQYGLVEASRDLTLSNASKGYLPQVQLAATATYQSTATQLDAKPGEMIDPAQLGLSNMPKDQYNATLTVNQVVYDGGAIRAARRVARAEAAVQSEQLNVQMYDIRNRINDLYFGILLLDAQIRQSTLLQEDLRISHSSVSGMMKGGVANLSDLDAINVEIIKAQQHETNLRNVRQTYLAMLSQFIGQKVSDATHLTCPPDEAGSSVFLADMTARPELSLYDAQERLASHRLSALNAGLRPKLGIFLLGGYGKPGLNQFERDFKFYYRVGAQLSWDFGNFYTYKNSKRLLQNERNTINVTRETFLFNTNMQHESQAGNVTNLRSQISQDDQIVEIRERICQKSKTRVENGMETVNEMLREINALNEAKETKAYHEIQLIQEIYRLKNIHNN